ncbi:ATP-dependent DNA helicase [Trichonephila clavipes]|nr:ATP-dependent DNA helicase [Trichonephila clavipes]
MQDLNSNNKLFGGAILLLSGDFRQTLPVIPRSTFADEINACLKQSFLWRSVETLGLTINMRVQLQNDPSAQIFSEQLLHIGNGKIELQLNTQCIKLPDNFCTVVQDKNELIQSIFPDIQNNYLNHEWLSQRAILAAKNVDVDEINFQIQQLLPGDLMSFKSIDTVVDENESVNFPIEFLNSLDIPGMPPHNLRLKIGSPIILLRNLNPPQLCNVDLTKRFRKPNCEGLNRRRVRQLTELLRHQSSPKLSVDVMLNIWHPNGLLRHMNSPKLSVDIMLNIWHLNGLMRHMNSPKLSVDVMLNIWHLNGLMRHMNSPKLSVDVMLNIWHLNRLMRHKNSPKLSVDVMLNIWHLNGLLRHMNSPKLGVFSMQLTWCIREIQKPLKQLNLANVLLLKGHNSDV